MPYKFIAYDDLNSEPLKLYDYTRILGNVVEDYLAPEYIDENMNF